MEKIVRSSEGLAVEISFSNDYEPIHPSCADDMRRAVDAMIRARDPLCNTLWVWVNDKDGECVTLIYAGVFPDGGSGCLHYSGVDGDFFSRGAGRSGESVRLSNFGNALYFPADSVIGIEELKSVLVAAYEGDFVCRPDGIEWQEWFDLDPQG